jgi:hypothetical protein
MVDQHHLEDSLKGYLEGIRHERHSGDVTTLKGDALWPT